MRAVILCAGRGSRLSGFTEDRPKCLVELRGRSLLDRHVRALLGGGVTDVGVVAGWRADAFAGSGLRVFENPDWARTTMVDSLAAAHEWLTAGPLLVAYGDIVYPAQAVRNLAACGADLAVSYDPDWLALWRKRFADPLDDAETFALDPDGMVADIGRRPASLDEVRGQYVGLLRFTPRGWDAVATARADPDVRDRDMTGLLRHMITRVPVAGVPVGGPWCEFDHPGDLEVGADLLDGLDSP